MDGAKPTSADAWIYKVMEMVEEKGIDSVPEAREAVLVVKRTQRGESHSAELMPPHFDGWWK